MTATTHAARPRSRSRLWRHPAVGAAVALLVAAVAGERIRAARRPTPTYRFETAAVEEGPIVAKVTATGALSALVTVQVGSQVSGRVDALYADFAQTVRRGERIATIEPSLFRAAVAQARANLAAADAAMAKANALAEEARRAEARTNALATQGLATTADVEAAQADHAARVADAAAAHAGIAQAAAALDQAELNLRYTTIVSPIDGVVLSRNVDVGQTVAAAFQAPTLFTIAEDLGTMQVDTNVAEADVGKLRAGMPVTFTVDAYPHRTFDGTVRQVRDNPTTIQNVVTYDAVIDVANADHALKPGMTANASFVFATRAAAVRVPNGAVRFKPEERAVAEWLGGRPVPAETSVWVVRDGRPAPVPITLGLSDGTATELVAGGLRAGDRVVIEATRIGS